MVELLIATRFPYLILCVLGTCSWFITVFDKPLRTKFYMTPPLILTVLGIIIRLFIDQLHTYQTAPDWTGVSNLLMDVSQFVIAIQLMATALDLPRKFWCDWYMCRSLVIMLTLGMILTWIITAAMLYAFLYHITNFRICILIAACLTPTDPILAHAVVVGEFAVEHIPQHVRDVLNAESSLNDGIAYPLVQFGVFLVTATLANDAGALVGQWVVVTWLYEIMLGCMLSYVMGWIFGRVHAWCYHHQLIAPHATIPVPFFLVLSVLGTCNLCSMNGVLGVFVAGCVFALQDSVHQQMAQTKLQDAADISCNVFFILFGVFIPFSDMIHFMSPTTMIIMIIAIMILKRLPAMLILKKWLPQGTTYSDVIFTGWFGPIGVAGFYYVVLIAYESDPSRGSGSGSGSLALDMDGKTLRLITSVVSLIILSSVVIHAVTAIPVTRTLSQSFSKPHICRLYGTQPLPHRTHHMDQHQQYQHQEQAPLQQLNQSCPIATVGGTGTGPGTGTGTGSATSSHHDIHLNEIQWHPASSIVAGVGLDPDLVIPSMSNTCSSRDVNVNVNVNESIELDLLSSPSRSPSPSPSPSPSSSHPHHADISNTESCFQSSSHVQLLKQACAPNSNRDTVHFATHHPTHQTAPTPTSTPTPTPTPTQAPVPTPSSPSPSPSPPSPSPPDEPYPDDNVSCSRLPSRNMDSDSDSELSPHVGVYTCA